MSGSPAAPPGSAARSRIPALGPHGEGWVALQVVCFALLGAAVATGTPDPGEDLATAGTRQLLGYAIGIVAAAFLGSGIAELRRAGAFTAVPKPRDGAQLVDRGPYRLVRHPIYTGLLLGALGLAIITPWAGTFTSVALLAVVLDLKRRREEVWLAERYPGYSAYRLRTKALIPFLY